MSICGWCALEAGGWRLAAVDAMLVVVAGARRDLLWSQPPSMKLEVAAMPVVRSPVRSTPGECAGKLTMEPRTLCSSRLNPCYQQAIGSHRRVCPYCGELWWLRSHGDCASSHRASRSSGSSIALSTLLSISCYRSAARRHGELRGEVHRGAEEDGVEGGARAWRLMPGAAMRAEECDEIAMLQDGGLRFCHKSFLVRDLSLVLNRPGVVLSDVKGAIMEMEPADAYTIVALSEMIAQFAVEVVRMWGRRRTNEVIMVIELDASLVAPWSAAREPTETASTESVSAEAQQRWISRSCPSR